MESKQDIRARILRKRMSIAQSLWLEKTALITERVLSHQLFLDADQIYCYIDCRKETGTRKIIEGAWELGKKTAVPKIENGEMHFYYVNSFDELTPGHFQVPEPFTNKKAIDCAPLIIMPGVAFDVHCNRIGYGKGYYDRYLQEFPEARRMALSFEEQIVADIPSEEHDIKPELIVTEGDIYEEELFTGRWL